MTIKPFVILPFFGIRGTGETHFFSVNTFNRWCAIKREDILNELAAHPTISVVGSLDLIRLDQLAKLAREHFEVNK